MGLLTMGYGHLTIITMGLGNSIRILGQQERLYQAGEVSFEDVAPRIVITDELIKTSFEEREKDVAFYDKERKEVIENG